MKALANFCRAASACIALLYAGSAMSDIFHVDTSTELLDALNTVAAGDTISIAPGTYTASRDSIQVATGDGGSVWRSFYFHCAAEGTAEAPITLTSQDPSAPAVLSGPGWSSSGYALYITGDHWLIDNVKVTAAAKGVLVANSNNTSLNDVEIYEIGQEGLHILDGSSNTTVTGINIHDVGVQNDGYGEGIYIGSDNGVWWEGDGTNTGEKGLYYHRDVLNTHISDCTIGPNVTAEPFDIKEGAGGTIVENCEIYGTGISGMNFADSHIDIKGYNTIIRHNTFYQNNNTGIARAIMIVPRISAGVDAAYTAHHNYIHNNTFYLDSSDVEVAVANSGSSDIYAWDNVREPSDGNYYNSRILEEIPDGYYGDTTYYLTASAGANGSIIPSGTVTLVEGASQTFSFVPNSGYLVQDVKVNGVSIGSPSSYSFNNVSADQSITVSFVEDTSEPVQYSISVAAGNNGSISPADDFLVAEGESQSFTIAANSGYLINDVVVNGISRGAIATLTLDDINTDYTVAASFILEPVEPEYYQVSASADSNGSVSPAGAFEIEQGSSQTFSVTPNSGYAIADVIVNGVSIGAVSAYTASNVQADLTIVASFEKIDEPTGDYVEISAPFVYNGAGTFKWKTTSIPSNINSWNLDSLTLNGETITNKWIGPWSLPEKIDGYYYFEFSASFPWSHIEIK